MDKSGKGAFGFVTASWLKDENLQFVAQPVTLVQSPTAFSKVLKSIKGIK